MDEREIVFNLWYLTDHMGAIYSLRAHTYVADGSDPDKLAFPRGRASLDYLAASQFPLLDPSHVNLVESKADGYSIERPLAARFQNLPVTSSA